FGGHKGSALSMMVELLAAALTGGNFSFEFDWSGHPGARTPWTGQLVILIDPSKSAGQGFAERSQELVRQMHGVGLKRLPGDRRHRQREKSKENGIAIGAEDVANLYRLAGE
ncbi:Ldh family oxidoreductase, partial [Pseudomonas sp. MAFF 311095]